MAGDPSARRTARILAERIPGLLPLLAVLAAVAARLFPSRVRASDFDVLLGLLVLVTAIDIVPQRLFGVRRRLGTVLLLSLVPLVILAGCGWGLSHLVNGDVRAGVLSLGIAPAEVASVGLIV